VIQYHLTVGEEWFYDASEHYMQKHHVMDVLDMFDYKYTPEKMTLKSETILKDGDSKALLTRIIGKEPAENPYDRVNKKRMERRGTV